MPYLAICCTTVLSVPAVMGKRGWGGNWNSGGLAETMFVCCYTVVDVLAEWSGCNYARFLSHPQVLGGPFIEGESVVLNVEPC